MFLQQIKILEWFLKDHVTLKTEAMAAGNSALPNTSQNFKLFHSISFYCIFDQMPPFLPVFSFVKV